MIEYAVFHGVPETSRVFNQPDKTIYHWFDNPKHDDFIERLRKVKNNQEVQKIEEIKELTLNKIKDLINSGDRILLRDLVINFGTLYDKSRLSSGSSTQNIEINVKLVGLIQEVKINR